ncbi:MAG: glycosyltransferase family 4 protein [Oscillospiraceae bacterium]|nr:glycosyltransferase family 4 protein [Oscillospiraceae bacterium]
MKVYIYSEAQDKIEKSGVGRAVYHQKNAAQRAGFTVVDKLEDADVVHINTVLPNSYAMAKKLNKRGIPLVYHAHSTREDFRNSYIGSNLAAGLFKHWITACYSCGDVIVTPSGYSKSLLEGYGINKEIYVVSNGIDLDDYKRDEQAGRKFREKYGFSDNDKVVMSAGLLIRRKGVHDFVELARRCPGYKFIWFGDADLNFVGNEVRRAVKTAPGNMIFGGYVGKDKIKAALSGADLFLFPSYEETEGIIVLEALAMRIPVLLRNIPVYEEWNCSCEGGGRTTLILPDPSTNLRSLQGVYLKSVCPLLLREVMNRFAPRALTKRASCFFRHMSARYSFAGSACQKAIRTADPQKQKFSFNSSFKRRCMPFFKNHGSLYTTDVLAG